MPTIINREKVFQLLVLVLQKYCYYIDNNNLRLFVVFTYYKVHMYTLYTFIGIHLSIKAYNFVNLLSWWHVTNSPKVYFIGGRRFAQIPYAVIEAHAITQ